MAARSIQYISVNDEDAQVLIETDVTSSGTVPIAQAGLVEQVDETFDAIAKRIGRVVVPIRNAVQGALADASEVSMEFGIKISANAGVVIASSATEANFKVSIKWSKAK